MMQWWGEICNTTRGRWNTGRPNRQVYYIRGGSVLLPKAEFNHIIGYGISELGFIDLRPKPFVAIAKNSLFTSDGLEWNAEFSITLKAIDTPTLLSRVPIEHSAIREIIEEAIRSALAAALAPLPYHKAQMLSGIFSDEIVNSARQAVCDKIPYKIDQLVLRLLKPNDSNALDALEDRRRSEIISERYQAKHQGEIAEATNSQAVAELKAQHERDIKQKNASHRREMETQEEAHRLELEKNQFHQQQELAMLACRSEAIRSVIQARSEILINARVNREALKRETEQRRLEYDVMVTASGLNGTARDALILGKDGVINLKKIDAEIKVAQANADWQKVRDIIGLTTKGVAFGGKTEAYENMLRSRGLLPAEQNVKLEIGGGTGPVSDGSATVDAD